jgi:predicted AAA+ superfamily ATPase
MTEKEYAIRVLKEWFEGELPAIVEREIDYRDLLQLKEGLGIIGVRRAGKTFFMFQIAKSLGEIPEENIVYVNMEDRRLQPLTERSLDRIYEAFIENFDYDQNKPICLFLDEVQNVPEWERFVRNFYDNTSIKFIVSGSSSKILRTELSTLLTGRIIRLEIHPFSFREFLKAKDPELDLEDRLLLYSPRAHEIKRLFKEYLEFGGFPEVVLTDKMNLKTILLGEYLDGIINRDVISRYPIKNKVLLENLVNYLFSSFSSPFSFSKAHRFFKSCGLSVGKQTLIEYFSYMNEVFLFFSVPIFSYKIKDVLKYPVKMYCVDNGFIRVGYPKFSENLGRLAENIVFIDLKRRFGSSSVCYWKDAKGEVDFVITEGLYVKQLIQICWNVNAEETRKREVKSLLRAMGEFNLEEGLVITEDFDGKETTEGKTIIFLPLWRWLLL